MKPNIIEIDTKQAENIIKDFNKPNMDKLERAKTKSSNKKKLKSKKISKK